MFVKQIYGYAINENNINRESYSLTAGFGLGLINLAKGN